MPFCMYACVFRLQPSMPSPTHPSHPRPFRLHDPLLFWLLIDRLIFHFVKDWLMDSIFSVCIRACMHPCMYMSAPFSSVWLFGQLNSVQTALEPLHTCILLSVNYSLAGVLDGSTLTRKVNFVYRLQFLVHLRVFHALIIDWPGKKLCTLIAVWQISVWE